jgi:hypothetical protein
MEIDEIENESLCPHVWNHHKWSFFESLQEHEHFESIYKEALKESRLKYVAQFENGKQMLVAIHS